MTSATYDSTNLDIHFRKGEDEILDSGVLTVNRKTASKLRYPEWLPTWDPTQKFAPYEPFVHTDRGLFGDKEYKRLFPEGGDFEIEHLLPKLGTEVKGVQLLALLDSAKDDLALLVAERGVVVFRDQDLKDKGLEFNKQFGLYFGPLHTHPSLGAPAGYPEFHITYRRENPDEYKINFATRTTLTLWHSDVTYEEQPPGITFFAMLEGPPTGGDTVFADTEEAYKRLLPHFQAILEGLTAEHLLVEQARQLRAAGSIERRPPLAAHHPLVRTHPVTGRKLLFALRAFLTKIDGLKEEELRALLDFLTTHATQSLDFQVRARWQPGTVVVWDNRRVLHTATLDWDSGSVRHAYRITPMCEKPI